MCVGDAAFLSNYFDHLLYYQIQPQEPWMDRSMVFTRWRQCAHPSNTWFVGPTEVCSQMASRSNSPQLAAAHGRFNRIRQEAQCACLTNTWFFRRTRVCLAKASLSVKWGQCASSCQISQRSVDPLPRYDDLIVFKVTDWWSSAIWDF